MTESDRELLNRWLDGEADAAEVTALLNREPDAAAWLATYAALHADLQQSLSRRRLQTTAHSRMDASSHRRKALPFPKIFAGAAAAVLLVGLIWRLLPTPPPRDQPGSLGYPVEVVSAEETESYWQGGGSRDVRDLSLSTGHLTLRLARGVVLDIFAPTRLTVTSDSSIRLDAGKVTAAVGTYGKGFAITTPETRVVDLGTVFGVEATAAGNTDVVVFSGAVELDGDAPVERLTQGEAVRVNQAKGRKRISAIVTSRRRAEWSTAAPPENCAIRSVTDDAERAAERFAYHISPGGFTNGAEAYVELPFVFRNVPASLNGADLVQTFRSARKSPRFAMQVALARPAVLCVLFDQSGPVPAWLIRDYQKSADTVTLTSPDPKAQRTVTMDIWRREIRQPSSITCGPAREERDDRGLMYVIVAKALE